MSSKQNTAIKNAEDVIEKFGGIRPMAKKVEVAVTTVQGWKKRNVIPGGRRAQILEAAQVHNIDLSDVLGESAPHGNDNGGNRPEPPVKDTGEITEEETSTPAKRVEGHAEEETEQAAEPGSAEESGTAHTLDAIVPDELGRPQNARADSADSYAEMSLEQQLAEAEKKAITKSTWINLLLLFLGLGAIAVLLWPQDSKIRLSTLENDVTRIQGDVDAVKKKQHFLGALIPSDLDQKIAGLQTQASGLKARADAVHEGLGNAIQKAQEISDDVLARDSGTLKTRVKRLEAHARDLAASPQMAALLSRFSAWQGSADGRNLMERSVSEVSALIEELETDTSALSLGGALDQARAKSEVLNQAFEDVPAEELKAAVLLLGLTQFRSSLNRDNQAFEDDLQILLTLIDPEDVELQNTLRQLAPHAQTGVLTPAGLLNEFRAVAGDIIAASLKGEKLSVGERTKARISNIFQVKKDGEPVGGTHTQAAVAKAERLLEEGNLAGAIAHVKTLEGPEAEQAAPWLERAEATLAAQEAKALITRTLQDEPTAEQRE